MNEFLEMGGYAAFIWPAYGASMLSLGGLVFLSHRRLSRARRNLNALSDLKKNAASADQRNSHVDDTHEASS